MSRSADTLVRCGLCGFAFDPSALACHTGCPLAARCSLICCPRCGYEMVDESKSRLLRLVARRSRRGPTTTPRPRGDVIPLSHVAPGEDVRVESLEGMSASRSTRLSAFGLVPGSTVTVLQSRPVPVVRLGHTELSLAEDILDQVWVSPPR